MRALAASEASRALVGSSQSSTAGGTMVARARATRCRWPPDRSAGRRRATVAGRPIASSASATRRSVSARPRRAGTSRSRRISPTVIHGVSDDPASWNTICAPPSATVTRPDRAGTSPAMARSRVDLPDPLSPTIARAAPAGDPEARRRGRPPRSVRGGRGRSCRCRRGPRRRPRPAVEAGAVRRVRVSARRGPSRRRPRRSPRVRWPRPAGPRRTDRVGVPPARGGVVGRRDGGVEAGHLGGAPVDGERAPGAVRAADQALGRRRGCRPAVRGAGRPRSSARDSRERSRPAVYGWAGAPRTAAVGPTSARRPAYMTAMRSAIWAATARSWVMSRTLQPSSSRSSCSRSSSCACTVTSRAVVGSSATIRDGRPAIAIAAITRCRSPPESSCG